MSKLAHSNQETMDELDRRRAIENGDEDLIPAQAAKNTPDWKVLPYYGSAGENLMGFDIVEVGRRETSDRIAVVKLTDVYHGNKDTCKQRASLISAAPKLLEALKLAEELCTNLLDAVGDDEFNSNFKVIEKARAAIAEAEGR